MIDAGGLNVSDPLLARALVNLLFAWTLPFWGRPLFIKVCFTGTRSVRWDNTTVIRNGTRMDEYNNPGAFPIL